MLAKSGRARAEKTNFHYVPVTRLRARSMQEVARLNGAQTTTTSNLAGSAARSNIELVASKRKACTWHPNATRPILPQTQRGPTPERTFIKTPRPTKATQERFPESFYPGRRMDQIPDTFYFGHDMTLQNFDMQRTQHKNQSCDVLGTQNSNPKGCKVFPVSARKSKALNAGR